MKFTTTNGYMTLKIALRSTEITRTIVVPECMTLTDLNYAIQCVMGWEGAHLWRFQDGSEGPTYELPHKDDFVAFHKRLSFDSGEVTLGKAFPKKGAKLTYIYDFGDDWTHIVTRMTDPKTDEIACTKVTGPDGLEDFGGQWRLGAFIADMRENPNDEEWSDVFDWADFDDKERLAKYLKGESAETKTAKLKKVLSHVTVEVPTEAEKPKTMSDEEQARTLGLLFATSVSEDIWDILEDAFQHNGKCEFVDHDKTISTYLLTMFEGLKIKDGVQTPFRTNPSTLTVHKKWVEWYAKYGKDWKLQREQFDIMEEYALSVVHLYGAVKTSELYEIMLRYDPGLNISHDEVLRYLRAKALWHGIGYRIEGDLIVDDDGFAPEEDDQDKFIRGTMKMQKDYPRWYPSNRTELFKWAKISRNAPCPCGSGKKYKMCCGKDK